MLDDELTDDELEGLDPNIREALKHSKRTAHEKREAEERAAGLERELAFARAGIPDTPIGQLFIRGYDGEVAVDAIKAAFAELAPDEPPQQPPEEPPADDLDAQRQIAGLGSPGVPAGDIRFEDAIRSAPNAEAVMDLIRNAPPTATTGEGRGSLGIKAPEVQ